jgi:hypothetical protein
MYSKFSIILTPLLLILVVLINIQPAFAEDQAAGKDIEYNVGRMGDPAGVNPEEFEFSPAEEKLWLSDHLKNVSSPMKLFYEFEKKGSFEEGFVDSVILEIIHDNDDGTKNTRMEFFTEERNQSIPENVVRNIIGNPVLGIYLQGDVYEMDRLTEGHWRYFHRKIKLALTEDRANLEPVSIDFDGHTVPGEKITILPYVRDQRRSQFEQFADKRYEFILSEEIPGTLYQIKTLVPDNSDSAKGPLIEETLTLMEVKSSS